MRKSIKVGEFEVPKDYFTYDYDRKREVCDNILDNLFIYIDRQLDPEYNRILFLRDVLESSLESNVKMEHYEIAGVILDCIKLLDED